MAAKQGLVVIRDNGEETEVLVRDDVGHMVVRLSGYQLLNLAADAATAARRELWREHPTAP